MLVELIPGSQTTHLHHDHQQLIGFAIKTTTISSSRITTTLLWLAVKRMEETSLQMSNVEAPLHLRWGCRVNDVLSQQTFCRYFVKHFRRHTFCRQQQNSSSFCRLTIFGIDVPPLNVVSRSCWCNSLDRDDFDFERQIFRFQYFVSFFLTNRQFLPFPYKIKVLLLLLYPACSGAPAIPWECVLGGAFVSLCAQTSIRLFFSTFASTTISLPFTLFSRSAFAEQDSSSTTFICLLCLVRRAVFFSCCWALLKTPLFPFSSSFGGNNARVRRSSLHTCPFPLPLSLCWFLSVDIWSVRNQTSGPDCAEAKHSLSFYFHFFFYHYCCHFTALTIQRRLLLLSLILPPCC